MSFKNFGFYFTCLIFTFFSSLFLCSNTFAHVTILQPNSGDVIDGGVEFPVKWEIDEDVAPDTNWDIRFSRDGGDNWEVVTTNLESTIREFNWLVPNINTTDGRMEVIEDRATGEDDGGRTGTFTIRKSKSFSFNCDDDFGKWFLGLEKMAMEVGDEQSCTLKLTNIASGVPIKISTHLLGGRRSSVSVFPSDAITDENGEVIFTITALDNGLTWVSWAVPNENGEFEFNKKAFNNGTAWGAGFKVRD